MAFAFNPITGKLDLVGSGAAQVNSDWNATSGVAQILNKPTIPPAYTAPTNVTNLAFSELFSRKLDGNISGTTTQTGQNWVVSTPTSSNMVNTNGSVTLSNWTTATGQPRAYASAVLPAQPVRIGGLFSFNAGTGVNHAQFVLLIQPSNTDFNSCLHCSFTPVGITLQYNSNSTGGLSFVTVGSVTFPTQLRLDGTLYVFEVQLVGTTLSCKYGDPLNPQAYSVTDANLAGKGGVTATYEPFAAGSSVQSTLNLHALWAGSDADKAIPDTLNDVINNAARASGRSDFVRTESAIGRLISGLGSKVQTLGLLDLNNVVKTSGVNVQENTSSLTFYSPNSGANPPTGAIFYDIHGNANRKSASVIASGERFAIKQIDDSGNFVVGGNFLYIDTSAPNGSFLTYNSTYKTYGMQSLAAGTGISINTAWFGQNTISVSPLVSLDNIDNNFTAGQSITAPANTSALTASYSVTGANTTPLLDLSGTWNTTGVARGIRLNITDTASAATSALMDLGVGSRTQYALTKARQFWLYNSSPATQDASNFERGFMRWNSNVLEIGTEAGGTGTSRRIEFKIGTQIAASLQASGSGMDFYCRALFTAAIALNTSGLISGLVGANYATGAADPTTTTLTSGNFQVYRNTTSGTIRLWANNNGTLVSVALA